MRTPGLDKKVPAKDAVVTIGEGMNVVLDVTLPELHGLHDQWQTELRGQQRF